MTYSIVQDVGKVSVAVLDDEDGESKSVRLDAAVERVVARVDAADATPPGWRGCTHTWKAGAATVPTVVSRA